MHSKKIDMRMNTLIKISLLIIILLCCAGCKKSTSQLIDELNNNDIKVNAKAEEKLIAKGEETVPVLIEALNNSKSDEQKKNIAKTLGKLKKTEAVKPLFISVQNDLENEEYKNLVKNAIKEIGIDSAKTIINSLYRDEDSSFKKYINQIGFVGTESEKVFDSSLGINWNLIFERAQIYSATGGTTFEEFFNEDSEFTKLHNYMEEILVGIYETNGEEYVKLFKDNDPVIRNTAILALAKADIDKSMKTISDILSSNDKELKKQAIGTLGMIKDERALSLLTKLIDEKDSELRANLIFALGKFTDNPNALDAILALYSSASGDDAITIEGYINKIFEKIPQAEIDKLLNITEFKKADKETYKLGKAIVIDKDTKKLSKELYIKMPMENRVSLNNISELDSLVLLEWGDYTVGAYMNGIKACVKTCTVTVINFKNRKILGSKKFEGGDPPFIINYFEGSKPEKGFGTDPENDDMLKYILSFKGQ